MPSTGEFALLLTSQSADFQIFGSKIIELNYCLICIYNLMRLRNALKRELDQEPD